VPTGDTQLTFKARANRLTNVASTVQASVDGGPWTTVFTERSTDDEGFGDRVVPLGAFADRLVQLRFRSEPAGTGNWGCCGTEGWYLDDIALTNAFSGVTTVSDVGPDPTFAVTPTDGARLNLEVRAQFFGSGAGEWSPVKRITPLTPAAPPTPAPVPPTPAPAPPTPAPPPAGGLAAALDTTSTAATSGNAPWTPQTMVTHDGSTRPAAA